MIAFLLLVAISTTLWWRSEFSTEMHIWNRDPTAIEMTVSYIFNIMSIVVQLYMNNFFFYTLLKIDNFAWSDQDVQGLQTALGELILRNKVFNFLSYAILSLS